MKVLRTITIPRCADTLIFVSLDAQTIGVQLVTCAKIIRSKSYGGTLSYMEFDANNLRVNSFAARDGLTLYYSVIGLGPAILFLAGGPGLAVDYLVPIAERLADHASCILFHQRGTGLSQLSDSSCMAIDLNTNLADIEDIRIHLAVDKWTVFGHSYGGMLALAYAGVHASRIGSLILVAACGLSLDNFPEYLRQLTLRLPIEAQHEVANWSQPNILAEFGDVVYLKQFQHLAPAYFCNTNYAAVLHNSLPKQFNTSTYSRVTLDLIQRKFDAEESLEEVAIPTIIIQGRQDALGENVPRSLNSAIAGSKVVFIEDSGHFPWIEQPDSFFNTVDDFCFQLDQV